MPIEGSSKIRASSLPQALSALSSVADRVAEDAKQWAGSDQDKIQQALLPSIMQVVHQPHSRSYVHQALTCDDGLVSCVCADLCQGVSLLIEGGLLNQSTGSHSGSSKVEAVQGVASSLLDAVLASKVPGEEPVSYQAPTIGTLPHTPFTAVINHSRIICSISRAVTAFVLVQACRPW